MPSAQTPGRSTVPIAGQPGIRKYDAKTYPHIKSDIVTQGANIFRTFVDGADAVAQATLEAYTF